MPMEVGKLINKKDEAFWVVFEGDAEVLIKPCTPKRMRKIKQLCTTDKFRHGRKTESFDDEKFSEILNKEIVLDWKNFTSEGKEIKYSLETLAVFMDNWMEFNLFVQDAATNIRAYLDDKKEGELKN